MNKGSEGCTPMRKKDFRKELIHPWLTKQVNNIKMKEKNTQFGKD